MRALEEVAIQALEQVGRGRGSVLSRAAFLCSKTVADHTLARKSNEYSPLSVGKWHWNRWAGAKGWGWRKICRSSADKKCCHNMTITPGGEDSVTVSGAGAGSKHVVRAATDAVKV